MKIVLNEKSRIAGRWYGPGAKLILLDKLAKRLIDTGKAHLFEGEGGPDAAESPEGESLPETNVDSPAESDTAPVFSSNELMMDEPSATTAARELAEKSGVDLHDIDGSGVGGSILRGDVERYLDDPER